METKLRLVWGLDAGLPAPLCNKAIFDLHGRHLGTVDLLDPVAGVVGEYDGAEHGSAARRSRDAERTDLFRRVGLEQFTVVGRDLHRTALVVDRMRCTRQRALASTEPARWTLQPPPDREPELSLDDRFELRRLWAELAEQNAVAATDFRRAAQRGDPPRVGRVRGVINAPQSLKRAAVRTVKPVLSDAAWQRLRALAGRSGKQPARPAGLTPAQERRRRLRAMDLTELAQEFRTDKWGTHRYTPHYQRHLEHLRRTRFTLLEIGIGGYARERQGGASLRMWKHFFPRAQIVGLDIEDKSFVEKARIHTYQGSQVDEALLRRIVDEADNLLVVVDDGSHRPEHIRESFRILFPLLPDGAVYAIEDTQTSYWPEWGGAEDRHDRGTSMALVKDLVDGLNYEEYVDESYEPTYTDLHVVGVHAYHNLVLIEKGANREGTNRRKVLRKRYAEGQS